MENTFTSISDMADHILPLFKRFKHILLRMHWPSIDRIPNVKVPMLFVGGTQDEIVPAPHTKRLHDAAVLAPFK
jgi:pimeloyl-ACP methyl ester carboxylesterase